MKSFRSKFAALIFMMFLSLPRFVASERMTCVPPKQWECFVFSYIFNDCEAACNRLKEKEDIKSRYKNCPETYCKNVCDANAGQCKTASKDTKLLV